MLCAYPSSAMVLYCEDSAKTPMAMSVMRACAGCMGCVIFGVFFVCSI